MKEAVRFGYYATGGTELKVAVGFSKSERDFEHSNTALSTMSMLAQPVLRYGQGRRGEGGDWVKRREEVPQSHRRVHIASLYHCCEFGVAHQSAFCDNAVLVHQALRLHWQHHCRKTTDDE